MPSLDCLIKLPSPRCRAWPGDNAATFISDSIFSPARDRIKDIDGRGIVSTHAYDAQRRRISSVANAATVALSATYTDILAGTQEMAITDVTIAQRSEWDYDAQGNVTTIRQPRFFDSNDLRGYQQAQTTRTYTGRNLLASQTEAPGTLDQATEFFSYFLDKRQKDRTDARGNIWSKLWHICCGRLQATIDPAGHGTVRNTDFYGNVTHTAVVANLPADVTLYNWHDPIDADTISEVTTKYDGRHRPIARTQWLTPLSNVEDHARPGLTATDLPIADRDVLPLDNIIFTNLLPASEGLTTTWEYDDDLTDGIGIDAEPGLVDVSPWPPSAAMLPAVPYVPPIRPVNPASPSKMALAAPFSCSTPLATCSKASMTK